MGAGCGETLANGPARVGARLAALSFAAGLTACATTTPPPITHAPPSKGASQTPAQPRAGGTMAPYAVNGVWYYPKAQPGYDEVGQASWYGAQYHHRQTSDGEIFDMDRPSAAHTTLPLPCIVEVTNLDNGRRIRVRVNDRGPFVRGRILDLSRQGAKDLGFYDKGVARVRVRYVGPAPAIGGEVIETASFAPAPPQTPPSPRPSAAPQPALAQSTIRVQAGAFADRANAERAAALFSAGSGASIEPLDRGDAHLWRVVVNGAPGEDPQAARQRVVAAGFPTAKLLAGSPGA
jgi:rare lipoprotein A